MFDLDETPATYTIATRLSEDSPLAVFDLSYISIDGQRVTKGKERVARGLEALSQRLSGGDLAVPFYIEKGLTGKSARLFAVLPGVPSIERLRALARIVAEETNTRIVASCGDSGSLVDLPHSQLFPIAGRYAPKKTGYAVLMNRGQQGVDGSVDAIEDVFDRLIEACDHPIPIHVYRGLALPSEYWSFRPPAVSRFSDQEHGSQTALGGSKPESFSMEEVRLASPSDEPIDAEKFKAGFVVGPTALSPITDRQLHLLGFDLRPRKNKNVRLLPVVPGAEKVTPIEIVPDPDGMFWAGAVGERRALVTKEKLRRDPGAEGTALEMVLAHVVSQFEASTDEALAHDGHGLLWNLGTTLFPGFGFLYVELDDHDETLPLDDREDRPRRFLAALDDLLGPVRIVATKHPSIVASGRRGAFGVHVWYLFAFDPQKKALARLKKDIADRAGIPESSLECHSGAEAGNTRFIIDAEYGVLRSGDARLTSVQAVHDEVNRLKGLGRRLPRRYITFVEGQPFVRTPARKLSPREGARSRMTDLSRFSYSAGGREIVFKKIAGFAGRVAGDENQAGDLAWDIAQRYDGGSKDMADPGKRPFLEKDIRGLAARSHRQYHTTQWIETGPSEPYIAKGPREDGAKYRREDFVIKTLSASEEKALRERIDSVPEPERPRRSPYREAAVDSVFLAYRFMLARFSRTRTVSYENEDGQGQPNGYATMERTFIDALGLGVRIPRGAATCYSPRDPHRGAAELDRWPALSMYGQEPALREALQDAAPSDILAEVEEKRAARERARHRFYKGQKPHAVPIPLRDRIE